MTQRLGDQNEGLGFKCNGKLLDCFQQRNAKWIYSLEDDSGCCVGNGL